MSVERPGGCRAFCMLAVLFKKLQQCGIDLRRVCPVEAMRTTFDDVKLGAWNQFRGSLAGSFDRQDLVAVPVNDQGRHVDLSDVAAEVL